MVDFSASYANALINQFNSSFSSLLPTYSFALTTPTQQRFSLGGANDYASNHKLRVIAALSPFASHTGNLYFIDENDREFKWRIAPVGNSYPHTIRIGQQSNFTLSINETAHGQAICYPINLWAPQAGPSAAVSDITLTVGATVPTPVATNEAQHCISNSSTVYFLVQANGQLGSYTLHASTPGHNTRYAFNLTNVPLPVPSLTGRATVNIPFGASSVSVAANAPTPFMLNVADKDGSGTVIGNIDDTTKWDFSSSVASDTLPAEIQQSDGSVNFALTFATLGPRTITVTSKGDASVTATWNVVVMQSTQTKMSTGPATVYGQALVLSASVGSGLPPPLNGGKVTFFDGAATLGAAAVSGCSATLSVSTLTVGSHTVRASYSGVGSLYAAGSNSSAVNLVVGQAATTTALSAPGSITTGQPLALVATVAVVAPGAGIPTGSVTISDGAGASCSYSVPTGNGCSLTPIGSGNRTLTATYSGDGNFLASSVGVALDVLKKTQTITFAQQSPSNRSFLPNQHFDLNPFASASSGLPVSYTTTTPTVCTILGTTVSVISPGICGIAADQAGDDTYAAASEVTQAIAISVAAVPAPIATWWMLGFLGALLAGTGAWSRCRQTAEDA